MTQILQINCYVYFLLDPRNFFLPFYVGKGTGRRAYSHLQHHKSDNQKKKKVYIAEIRDAGFEPKVLIWKANLTTEEAKLIESEQIIRFGRIDVDAKGILTNSSLRGHPGYGASQETRDAISKANTGIPRPKSEETKMRMSEAALARPAELKERHCKNMKEVGTQRKGVKLTPKQLEKRIGVKRSPETVARQSAAMKGVPKSPQHTQAVIASKRAKRIRLEQEAIDFSIYVMLSAMG